VKNELSSNLLDQSGTQTLAEHNFGRDWERGGCVSVKWVKMRVLGRVRVFGSLWASPRSNWFGTTLL